MTRPARHQQRGRGAGLQQQSIRCRITPGALVQRKALLDPRNGLWRHRSTRKEVAETASVAIEVSSDLVLGRGLPGQANLMVVLRVVGRTLPGGIGYVERHAAIRSTDILP